MVWACIDRYAFCVIYIFPKVGKKRKRKDNEIISCCSTHILAIRLVGIFGNCFIATVYVRSIARCTLRYRIPSVYCTVQPCAMHAVFAVFVVLVFYDTDRH